MAAAPIKSAEATSKIQFAVSLLSGGMNQILKKAFGLKDPLDFNKSLKMIGDKLQRLFPDPAVQSQLRGTLNRARDVRNQYSHDDFDVNRFEHDIECFLKLAELMGLSDCRREIKEFADVSDEDWEKLKIEGNAFYEKGSWTEAMDCYTSAIRINANNAILYSNRALCELKLSKFDLAREDAEDAIRLDPQQVKFYRSLSEALHSLELYEEAQDACKDGLKIDPRDETLLLRLRDCQAYAMDAQTRRQSTAGMEDTETAEYATVARNMLGANIRPASDVSPDDVCPMDSDQLGIFSEVKRGQYILKSGKGNVLEEKKAFEIFESAAKRGSAAGLYLMANMFKDGMAGLAKNPQEFFCLCLQASEGKPYMKVSDNVVPNLCVADAENSIGIAYRDGLAVDRDESHAFKWFLRAAQHGSPFAMLNLGVALETGAGCERNPESSRWWIQKAADHGVAKAEFNLADMLLNGDGGPIETSKAAELLKAAADQGLPNSLAALQGLMRCGAVNATSISAPDLKINEKSDMNDREAAFLQGINYLRGEGGFSKDLNLAEEFLRKASNLNHEKATAVLGQLLLDLKKNEDAVLLIRKVAERGDKDAQWTLGHLLAFGHGCPLDANQARKWLLRSGKSDQGSVDSMLSITAKVLELETSRSLSQAGLTFLERLERYMDHFASSLDGIAGETLRESLKILFQQRANPPQPVIPGSAVNLEDVKAKMIVRAFQGSKAALNYLLAIALWHQIGAALESGSVSEAFGLFRQADKAWRFLAVTPLTWDKLFAAATNAFDRNPRDADALYIIAQYKVVTQACSNAELLRIMQTCTSLNPSVADYHNLQGDMHAYNEDFVAAQRSFERALELEWNPDWLYFKASAYRHQDLQDRSIVIATYEEFISVSELDHRYMPEACYSLAMEYIKTNAKTARAYYEKGLRAESPNVRLPCLQPVNFPEKHVLKLMLDRLEPRLNSASSGNQCASCGKVRIQFRCSRCRTTYYCDRECQLIHWKEHKKHCAA